jgi:selenocysteine lyase/cysteine desulfurase
METTPVQAKKIEYTYPVSDDFLCDSFESAIKDLRREGKNPRVAIYDTVVSLPGVRMPFERLTKLCKQHNVLSCVDGAHGVGYLPLDLSALDPDFFVSNCHKWLYTPRGSALFYVPQRNQYLMRSTLPTSHGFEPKQKGSIKNPLPPSSKSEFVTNFEFVGTHDGAPYCTIPAALEWRSKVTWNGKTGEDAVTGYMQHLARRSGEVVSSILKTEILENEEGTLGQCNFSNIRLPLSFAEHAGSDEAKAVEIGQWIERTCVTDYSTYIAQRFFGGGWWTRMSAQIYLTEQDFEWAGHVLNEICARVRRGEWKESKPHSKL